MSEKTSDDFMDADFRPEDGELILPPAIQWINGSGDPNHPPVLSSGGFELPVERFGYILEGNKTFNVRHSGGEIVEAYLYDKLSFSILAIGQKQWFTYNSQGQRSYLPANFQRQDGQKISSRTRIYAICRELENEPIILTFTGTGSQAIEAAIQQFRRQVISAATRMAAKKKGKAQPAFPLYAFWFEIKAGKQITFDKGGSATPPELATAGFSQKDLQKIYVGQQVLDLAAAEKVNADVWAERESQFAQRGSQVDQTEGPEGELPPYAGEGNGKPRQAPPPPPNWHGDEGYTEDQPVLDPDQEIPF